LTGIVVGVWVVTLSWLVTGFLVFTFAIARPLRDKGVSRPLGFHPPAFIGSHSRELTAYRVQRLRTGRGLAWWRFMIAWRFLFALLALASLLITLTATLEVL
jgi:hypothetical protein